MADSEYKITYLLADDVIYKAKSGMAAYLAKEQKLWKEFLERLGAEQFSFSMRSHQINSSVFGSTLATLLAVLDEENSQAQFNRQTSNRHIAFFPPPPSNSPIGQAILALFHRSNIESAIDVFLTFQMKNAGGAQSLDHEMQSRLKRGERLLAAIEIVVALPPQNVSARKQASLVAQAEAHVDAISETYERLNDRADTYLEEMGAKVEGIDGRAGRLENICTTKEKSRKDAHYAWKSEREAEFSAFKMGIIATTDGLLKSAETKLDQQLSSFQEMEARYKEKLRFDAPVALWGTREGTHSRNSKSAKILFWVFVAFAVLVAAIIPTYGGGFIASKFYENICWASHPAACERVFSIQGPLIVSGLLFFTSLILWLIRMQYRIFLSERHLAIDASERKAFAETFLALREDNTVSGDSEAIVLSSLFRPTQDGIVKDDESGFDFSAASVLAKQLGGAK